MTGFLLEKPLPSLAEWLGDGARADGFEEWVATVAMADKIEEDPEQQASLRMLRTFLIALVEAGRIESERHGRTATEVVHMMARVAGGAVMAAALSVLKEDAPRMRVAKILADDFGVGAKAMVKAAQ